MMMMMMRRRMLLLLFEQQPGVWLAGVEEYGLDWQEVHHGQGCLSWDLHLTVRRCLLFYFKHFSFFFCFFSLEISVSMLLQYEHNYIRAEQVLLLLVVVAIIIIISNIITVIIFVCFWPQIKELIHRVDEAKAKETEVRALAEASAFTLGIEKDVVVHGNMFYLVLVCNALLLQWSLIDTVGMTLGLVWQERVTITELDPGESWYSKHWSNAAEVLAALCWSYICHPSGRSFLSSLFHVSVCPYVCPICHVAVCWLLNSWCH